jgi:hypothetical protein
MNASSDSGVAAYRAPVSSALAGMAVAVCAGGADAAIVSNLQVNAVLGAGGKYVIPTVPDLKFENTGSRAKVTATFRTGIPLLYAYPVATGVPYPLLPSGALIGPDQTDPNSRFINVFWDLDSASTFAEGYLPFIFFEPGSITRHFGWADLTISGATKQMTVRGYGYEDVAGVQIAAGQTGPLAVPLPSTLALAAAGALAGAMCGRGRRRSANRRLAV